MNRNKNKMKQNNSNSCCTTTRITRSKLNSGKINAANANQEKINVKPKTANKRLGYLANSTKSPENDASNPAAIYEFKYDPKKDAKPKYKTKRGRKLKNIVEDDDISFVQNIKRKKNKPVTPVIHNLRNRVVTNVTSSLSLENKAVTEIDQNDHVLVAPSSLNANLFIKTTESDIKTENIDNVYGSEEAVADFDKSTARHEYKHVPVASTSSCVEPVADSDETAACNKSKPIDEVHEIADTFLEDLGDDYDDFNDLSEEAKAIIDSPNRIDIISKLIARNRSKPSPSIFNSTMIDAPHENPWRVEFSVIRKKPQYFSIKDKSFTPCYTPDIIENKSIKTQSSPLLDLKSNIRTSLFDDPCLKKSPPLKNFIDSKLPPNPRNKTILDLKSPFENINNSESQFDSLKTSPRKVFTDISNNTVSSVKFNRTKVISVEKPDDNLFGFTVLSDSDNDKENTAIVQKPRRKLKNTSPRNKIKEVINEQVPFKTIDNDIQSVHLFEDLEADSPNMKRFSRQYSNRKKNISTVNDSSDNESESEIIHVKKKQKNVMSKKEAEDVDKLASHYNSMFEEIEKFPLAYE